MPENLTDLFAPGPEKPPAAPLETESETGEESLADLFTRKTPARRGVGEQAAAVGQGVVGGLAEAGPVVGGAYMGAKSGAAIGAFGGPAAPVTVPLGAAVGSLVGAGAGYLAGRAIRSELAQVEIPWTGQKLTFDDMLSVPLELRPYAAGGETFGQTAAFAMAPYMLVRDGFRFAPNLTGRILNTMIEGAAQAPGRFAVAELAMGATAGVGRGVAESQFPGEPGPAMAGEIIGGFVNPTRWTIAAYRLTTDTVRKVASSVSKQAQRSRAEDYLIKVITEHGEDPEALAAALRETDIPGVDLTAGQKTVSPALLALEARLIRESAQYGEESRKMAENSLESLKGLIQLLEAGGNPESLRAAAQARSDYFNLLLNNRLHSAEQKALEAAANIDMSKPGALADYGRQTGELLSEAMTDVRAVERGLWAKVDKAIPATSDNIIAQYDAIRAERLPEETLPAIVEGFVKRTKPKRVTDELTGETIEEVVEIDTGELVRFRSRALENAREAAAKNEWGDARVYGQLAEAALDDLAEAQVTEPAYQTARNYSRKLNDVFSRTFAGKAMERAASGAPRMPPELIMRRAFGQMGEMTELQLRQLEEAAGFAGAEHLSRMLDLQEKTTRAAATQTLDTMTGRIKPARLAKFRTDNAQLLERFPNIKTALEDAQSAETFLRSVTAGNTQAERAIRNNAAFSRILGGEDTSKAVGRVLTGDNPRKEFTQLARLAGKDTPAADGLKSATFRYAFNKASSEGGFSFKRYRGVFNEALGGGGSLKDLMVREGVATKRAMNLLDDFLERASKIEEALLRRAPIEEIPDKGTFLYDFALRVTGARLAAVAPTGGAHGLIVGGAGSRAARQILDKIPHDKTEHFLMELSKHPETMAAVLESPKGMAAKRKIALQMNAFLWQSGVMQGYPAAQDSAEDFYLGP